MRNVILITIDCLRTDKVGSYGCSKSTTPNMDALADHGTVFQSCFANAGTTAYSFPSLLGSVFYEMYEGNEFPSSVPLLSETFSKEGYITAGINAANPNLTPEFGYERGFDYFVDFISRFGENTNSGVEDCRDPTSNRSEKSAIANQIIELTRDNDQLFRLATYWYQLLLYRIPNPYRKLRNYLRYLKGDTPNALSAHVTPSASEIINLSTDWLSNTVDQNDDFFLWIHLMDPHSWYDPDHKFIKELYEEEISRRTRFQANRALMSASPLSGAPDRSGVQHHLDTLQKLYTASVREADAAIGTLQDFLSKNDLIDDTIISITSDHGEEFLEHGNVQHSGQIHTELTHVPLIIAGPDIPSGVNESICQLLDIAPTLTGLLEIDTPTEYQGRDLSSNITDGENIHQPIVSVKPDADRTVAARDSRYTLIDYEQKKMEFFDRKQDPFEQKSQQLHRRDVSDLEETINSYYKLVAETEIDSNIVDPSEEIKEQLEHLGYRSD